MTRFKLFSWPLLSLLLVVLSASSAGKTEEINYSKLPSVYQIPQENLLEMAIFDKKRLKIEKAVNTYFKAALDRSEIIGAGVSIVSGDEVLYSNGFGLKEANENNTINAKTVFRLGSISKGFAGILSGIYVNKGLLHWDDKVVDYLPSFRLGDALNTSKISLANILSQSSGTPYHSYTNLVEAGLSLEDIAERFVKVHPISAPGQLYSYQNAIFALSGEMMAKATHQTIGEGLAQNVFEPLGMDQASTDFKTLMASADLAYPHVKTHNGWLKSEINEKYFNAVAAGGVNASPQDMGKWMRALLGHRPEVIAPQVLHDVFSPSIEIKGEAHYYQQWPGQIVSFYGYGWRMQEYMEEETREVKTVIHHGGAVSNYRNEIALYPQEDMGICVLFNSNTSLSSRVIPELHAIIKKIMDEPMHDFKRIF